MSLTLNEENNNQINREPKRGLLSSVITILISVVVAFISEFANLMFSVNQVIPNIPKKVWIYVLLVTICILLMVIIIKTIQHFKRMSKPREKQLIIDISNLYLKAIDASKVNPSNNH